MIPNSASVLGFIVQNQPRSTCKKLSWLSNFSHTKAESWLSLQEKAAEHTFLPLLLAPSPDAHQYKTGSRQTQALVTLSGSDKMNSMKQSIR